MNEILLVAILHFLFTIRVLRNFCRDLCFCIPRILAADASTRAIVVAAAAIIAEGVFFVVVPNVIFLSFNFSR